MPEPMDACLWLNFLQGSCLSEPARALVDSINATVDIKIDVARIHTLIERLLNLSKASTSVFEQGEINIQCALAYYRSGEYAQAVHLLEEAEGHYQRQRHYRAVVLWMKGCILWKMPDQHDLADEAWSQSQKLFAQLSSQSALPKQRDWYNERAKDTDEALRAQLKLEEAPVPIPEPQRQAQPASSDALLQLFRVIEKVPAGGFGPVGYDAVTIGAIEVNQVLINAIPHRIASLRGAERLIRLPANHYVVVEVTGDSMNNPPTKIKSTGIDKGDYVLLLEQANAKDGDIVAAEIDNEDSSATLKRFHVSKTGARYILSPESTNLEYQPRTFTHLDEGFHIRGIALAVFKPL